MADMNPKASGFTLIELMITVAILAILVSVALPTYQNYASKAQATGALRELAPTKELAEEAITRAVTPSLTPTNAGYIGKHDAISHYCNYTIDAAAIGATVVRCSLKNVSPALAGTSIEIARDADTGRWQCRTSAMAAPFVPDGCVAT
jgi:prepilin-type N-terminal cleavage/methylation domain-containing protein